ncbi:TonB-dependent receptor domain-containing protein [Roseateles asaccharophilus]|uniref:Iron complex outermembrane receptor protein n=1 Tax=Roseateles asaccharophilus TaxID=582607 RepID=A0ABU2ADD1_9BURK|nr:TonB-dependent receptor [Roseateles asaccharophilus]MDR7335212.1 iron complex outermembrane receptor protein [Roseateles asaccharophilus]
MLRPGAIAAATALLGGATSAQDLTRLSLEELSAVEVSSASRRVEKLARVPASLYVITADAIRRSGARSLPEALRLAPNLQVARLNADQYAITARGFNNAVGNKLLVLIDGRTVYAPYFSGVQWDQQDVMLEDVARIEVTSGPGGSVWGTNAVNGIIHIIRKPAAATPGLMLVATGSASQRSAGLRWGGSLPGQGHWRAYAKLQRQQAGVSEAGNATTDASRREQLGWRADWLDDGDGVTLQGDIYRGDTEDRVLAGLNRGGVRTSGTNVLARWTGRLDGGSRLRARAYYDHVTREDRLLYSPRYSVLDLELQHSVGWGAHQLDWGGGWRRARDRIAPGLFFGFTPDRATQRWLNLFVQDQWQLNEQWQLTVGTKFEHNGYTGWEALPSLRVGWMPSARQQWWASLSRAVRAPARLDRDLRLPPQPPFLIAGGPDFVSEVARVVELGHRGQPMPSLNYALTLYHHDWSRLRSGQPPPNAMVQNMIAGGSWGLEAWGQWQPLTWLKLSAGLNRLHQDLAVQPGSRDPVGPSALGNDPRQQWQLRASLQPHARHELDLGLRRVAALPNPAVPAYTVLDLHYAWRAAPGLELMLGGQNLLSGRHAEANAAPGRNVWGPEGYVQLRWSPL